MKLSSKRLAVGLVICWAYAWRLGPPAFCAEAPSQGLPPLRYEFPTFLAASIYGKKAAGTNVLFTFKRRAKRSGNTLDVAREFAYPDGKPAARQHLIYEGDALVLYELEELQIGAKGTARLRRDPHHPEKDVILFEYSESAGAKPQARSERLQSDTLIDDMVGPFLASHWDLLMKGEKIKCRYVVIPRRETVGFTFFKKSESTWQGKPVVIVRMEATSPIVGAVVDPLFFAVEKAPAHLVLEYSGRTVPKTREGNKWRDLDAVTVFDWASTNRVDGGKR